MLLELSLHVLQILSRVIQHACNKQASADLWLGSWTGKQTRRDNPDGCRLLRDASVLLIYFASSALVLGIPCLPGCSCMLRQRERVNSRSQFAVCAQLPRNRRPRFFFCSDAGGLVVTAACSLEACWRFRTLSDRGSCGLLAPSMCMKPGAA